MSQQLRKLLNEAKGLVGIEDSKLKVVLYPMKRKVASVSLKTKTIRLNREIALKLDEELLRYLLVHELIHFKLRSLSHDDKFWKELEKIYPLSKVKEIEHRIINSTYERKGHPY